MLIKKSNLLYFNILMMIFIGIFSGCLSSRTHTSTTKTVTADGTEKYSRTVEGNQGNFPPEERVIETTTVDTEPETTTTVETTTTETTAHESRGIIGTVFHFIGQVIALPFKLIGGLFEAIF